MIYEEPVDFPAAAEAFAVKRVIPTTLDTEELGKEIHRIGFTSARVKQGGLLDMLKQAIQDQLDGRGNEGETRVAMNRYLAETGYRPEPGTEGTIQDLGSLQRQNLIIRTNLATSRGYGQLVEQNDPVTLDGWPAKELTRFGQRMFPRGDPHYKAGTDGAIGWDERWIAAAEDSGDDDAAAAFEATGRMVALKASPIWDSLGNLWDDSLGNNFPPFAWDSGMNTIEVDREDAEELGLLDPEDEVKPANIPALGENFEMSADIKDSAIARMVASSIRGKAKIANGILTLKSQEFIASGDLPGHEFHGNQWTEAQLNAPSRTLGNITEHAPFCSNCSHGNSRTKDGQLIKPLHGRVELYKHPFTKLPTPYCGRCASELGLSRIGAVEVI